MCGRPSPRTLARQAQRKIGAKHRRCGGKYGLATKVEKYGDRWRAVLVEDAPVFFQGSIHPLAGIETYQTVLCELGEKNPPHTCTMRAVDHRIDPLADFDSYRKSLDDEAEARLAETEGEMREELEHHLADKFYRF